MPSSAARTNLDSKCVRIYTNQFLGEGRFRTCCIGIYVGGNRNQQAAACKCFKPKYRLLEKELLAMDDKIIKRTIRFAEAWNEVCPAGRKILVSAGYTTQVLGKKYYIEPIIRYFTKFTSNNGWIDKDMGSAGLYMEAFTHFTYHASGGQMIVCDLQGRYRNNDRYDPSKSRFELTDPAICSRHRSYGPTDLGEKGIESFFYNHVCNEYCQDHWQSPNYERNWFSNNNATSMISSSMSNFLMVTNNARFTSNLKPIYDDDDESADSSDY
mmetsp:Transcript_9650/g.28789  ORF Transcript_9650/g.28789 Transcript_9650/m.28789 type:complete len:269 (+) Transcript_9650:76-882(+)